MACCQVNCKLILRPAVQWFFTILVITICSHAKPCTCSSSSNHVRNTSYTWNTSFQQMNQGLLFLLDNESVILQQGSLGYYMQENTHPGFSLTDSGWFLIPKWFDPWKMSHGDDHRVDLNETISFSIVFTLSAVSTIDPFLFDILPTLEPPDDRGTAHPPPTRRNFFQNFTDTLNITSQSGKGIRVTATFSSSISTYSMRINYDRSARNLSVYLVRDADVGTTAATTQLNATDTLTPDALLFAITSSMGQLLELHNWNFTIKVQVTEQSRGPNIATIVSSVFGSAAATATIAAAVYFYLNSKYRRWKKDLDKLTKTMQSLPGVPMQVDFADIKKATNSFHETMRLGQEGNLLAAVDAVLTTSAEFDADEAIRLLQLGMACSSSNPSDRPSMVDAVQIISKSVPPPDIPLLKPPLVWPPGGWESSSSTSDSSMSTSNFNTTSTFMVEMTASSREHISSEQERGRFTSYPRRKKIFAGGRLRLSL
ncbi:unnamed protein product [Miscanthus lutarioriparius]|uniref:Uncharacterized protein n=1 Tax=Miscanthus lutarioriparius TaxID=422564 RepID=A0A811NNU3_9POAL|nr:unnamed protein product [Miscanthus lutarioriparius]